MQRWDRLTGILLLAFAGYTMVTAVRLGYWQGRIPGPGFAPIWIGAGLALCALFLLLRRTPGEAEPRPSPHDRIAARRESMLAAQIAAVALIATLLIPRVGMLTGLGLMLLALVKLLGGTWRSAVGTVAVLSIAFHLVFVRWLAVPVPKGPWGF